MIYCGDDQSIVTGGCGSGENGDCGYDEINDIAFFNSANCCDNSNFENFNFIVDTSDESCFYQDGMFGEKNQCPEGYLVNGLCGSGRYADCDGAVTVVRCCPFSVR